MMGMHCEGSSGSWRTRWTTNGNTGGCDLPPTLSESQLICNHLSFSAVRHRHYSFTPLSRSENWGKHSERAEEQ